MDFITQTLLTIGLSTVTSGAIVWLLKEWISNRLKGAISYEYSEKLQEHKMRMDDQLAAQKKQFDADLQAVRLAHEVNQTRTSLFFDHQRNAFSEISSEISSQLTTWGHILSEAEPMRRGFILSFKNDLQKRVSDHQIFVDPECQAALELVIDIYNTYAGRQDYPHEADVPSELQCVLYLRPRIVALFQKKIGVPYDTRALGEIGVLGVIWHMSIHGPAPNRRELLALDLMGIGAVDVVEHGRSLVDELKTYAVEYQVRTHDISGARKIMSYAHLISVE